MTTPSAGAMRAARAYLRCILSANNPNVERLLAELATIIDRETGHAALVEAAKKMTEAAAFKSYGDDTIQEFWNAVDALRAALAKAGAQ